MTSVPIVGLMLEALEKCGFRMHASKSAIAMSEADASAGTLQRWAPNGIFMCHAVRCERTDAAHERAASRTLLQPIAVPGNLQLEQAFVFQGPEPSLQIPLAKRKTTALTEIPGKVSRGECRASPGGEPTPKRNWSVF